MSDLISRQALRDAMYHEAFETDTKMQRWDSGCWIRYKLFENVIDNLPSAEQKGKWIRMTADGVYWYECSECHEKPLLNRWHKQDEMSKFCPNCGADMRGEEE